MKKVTLLLTFFTLLTYASFANSSKIRSVAFHEKNFKVNNKTSLKLQTVNAPTYFWGFSGDCMQLFSIQESSYIDYSGMSQPSYLVIEINSSNSVGLTYRICPPAGNSYC